MGRISEWLLITTVVCLNVCIRDEKLELRSARAQNWGVGVPTYTRSASSQRYGFGDQLADGDGPSHTE